VKDIFAPAKGLERGADGKLQVDKEQVVEKAEPVFEIKKENLVADELKKSVSSVQSTKTASSGVSEEKKAGTGSPTKRMTLMERQAEADAKKKEARDAALAAGGEAPKSRIGGL
jgi:hypothetical protein